MRAMWKRERRLQIGVEVLGQTSGDKLSAVTVVAGTWTRGSDGVLG